MPSTISKSRKIALGAARRSPSQPRTLDKTEFMERTLRKWGPNVLTIREEQIFRSLFDR